MTITPLDIYNKEFRKTFRGYEEEEVDDFLDTVVKEYEKIFKENIELKEALALKDSNIDQYKELEETLKKTLVVAQKTADNLQDGAVKEAELVIREADLKAEQIIVAARKKAEVLLQEYEEVRKQSQEFKIRFRTLLKSHLELIGENDFADLTTLD